MESFESLVQETRKIPVELQFDIWSMPDEVEVYLDSLHDTAR